MWIRVRRTCAWLGADKLAQICGDRRVARVGGSGSGAGSRGGSGKGNWWLVGGSGQRFFAGSMSGLLASGFHEGYHGEERLDGLQREAAQGRAGRYGGEVRGSHRDDALNPGREPDDTNAAEPLFGSNADKGEGQAVERVGGISDCNRVDGKCGQVQRGIVLGWFCVRPRTVTAAAHSSGSPPRSSLRSPPVSRTPA